MRYTMQNRSSGRLKNLCCIHCISFPRNRRRPPTLFCVSWPIQRPLRFYGHHRWKYTTMIAPFENWVHWISKFGRGDGPSLVLFRMGNVDKKICNQNRWVRHDKKFVTSQVGQVAFRNFVLLKYRVIGTTSFPSTRFGFPSGTSSKWKLTQLDCVASRLGLTALTNSAVNYQSISQLAEIYLKPC